MRRLCVCKSAGDISLKSIKDHTLEFSDVIAEIQTFLEPIFDAIVDEEEWQSSWNTSALSWK